MEWLERMNKALQYMEDNISSDISFEEAARIACCSSYHFQRMFSFITGVTLAEYIRHRRLTMAALELQNRSVKIIDLALKYGYESPDAFTRAFQKLHGVTPSAAREPGVKLKAYPRISFQISVKGEKDMGAPSEACQLLPVKVRIRQRLATSLTPTPHARGRPNA